MIHLKDDIFVTFEYDPVVGLTHAKVGAYETNSAGRKEAKWTVTGEAVCHPKDQFNRFIGRKLALARAFEIFGFSYEERSAMWKRFFEQVRREQSFKFASKKESQR